MTETIDVSELKHFLDEKVEAYNQPRFIESDPICIPHEFSDPNDIAIIGFIVATIAWGQRPTIINNGKKLMAIMGNSPYDFVMSATDDQLVDIHFVHRTYNSEDLLYFMSSLRNIYQNHGGLELALANGTNTAERLSNFKQLFFSLPHPARTTKHVADPLKGSSAKRLNMFLRWMVRKDSRGVDFGLWNAIDPSELQCPLDVHTGNVARKLGLLSRKQSDWKAVEELTNQLRSFDFQDPVKYDYALFGLGIFEKF